jgi:virulence-associated protein VapD
VEEQKRALQRYKYINQLARMEFEDKQEEVYSRYTRVSRQTVIKKIKARNQIADFEDEDED